MITEKSRTLIDLPLMMFLRLADGNGKMTAREMERFDDLIADRRWCKSQLLQRALVNAEMEKPASWKRYVAGEFRIDVGQVAASLDTVLSSIGEEERRKLEADLMYFCRELFNAARGGAGLLPPPDETKDAYDQLLDLVQRPSARAAQTVRASQPEERVPPTLNSFFMLVGDINDDLSWDWGKIKLRCLQIIEETRDVRTFRFVAEPAKLFRYYPGQFITLEIPIDGRIVRRSYTISATPSRPHSISITVKRVDEGQISNWLHDNLRVGSSLFADGPHGKFTCIDDEGDCAYLFISGGSGATPVMAMTRWFNDTAPGTDIRFIHFARTPEDLLFESELRLMEQQLPKLRCDFICTRVEGDGGWSGRVGRISAELLTELVPDLHRRTIYLCGPVPFMDAAQDILVKLGFDMKRYRQESFGGVAPATSAEELENSAPAQVIFSLSNAEVECRSSDYVLDVALAHGVPATFSCRAGQCGTCKVALLEGSVQQHCVDGLTEDEVKDGLILTCQSKPNGRVVIEL